jgi:hypothetical protein
MQAEQQQPSSARHLGESIGMWGATGGTTALALSEQPRVQQFLRVAFKRANQEEEFDPTNERHQSWLQTHVAMQKQATLRAWQKLPEGWKQETRESVKAACETWDELLSYGAYLAKSARVQNAQTPAQEFVNRLDPLGLYQVSELRDRVQSRAMLGVAGGFAGGAMLAGATMPYKPLTVPVMGAIGGLIGGAAGISTVPRRSEMMRIYVDNAARQHHAFPVQ